MKQSLIICLFFLLSSVLFAKTNELVSDSIEWKKMPGKGYAIYYTSADESQIKSLNDYLRSGIAHIIKFFDHLFEKDFDVYLFPDRSSLDKQWQKDWGDPNFKSECWMIASGVAYRLDILSPNAWAKEACDHSANDSIEIRQVIWHELTHVFHGQYNPDHAFSYIEKLDWLVEGLATFVSGQIDEKRSQRVKQIVLDNRIPSTLDDFWKGLDKYGLSGSMVAFLDNKYGRKKLFELLKQTNKENALKAIGISENELLKDWKNSFK